ncbi:phage DNA packaging protein J [Zhihengliuella sp. ISTPL4]
MRGRRRAGSDPGEPEPGRCTSGKC